MTTLAFILVSWRPDAPAGKERAVAASAVGLAATGHHAVIITADRRAPASYGGAPVVVLSTLAIPDPCGDEALRAAIDAADELLPNELLSIFAAHRVDTAVYVGGLWGLGRVMPTTGPVRRVLALHVVGHDIDMVIALDRAELVIVPSLAETFGLVALEAMASGTPVVAFDIDHLPALIGHGGILVPREHGHLGLWRAARELLTAPLGYERTSRVAAWQARDYRPARIAGLLVKVVS